MGQSASQRMSKELMNLRLKTKSLERQSKKEEKKEKANKKKCKKAMQKGNTEGAKIYAESAIRAKNQALNMMKMAARMDAVAARVQTACDMQNIAKTMKSVTYSMDSVMNTMDINEISSIMDKFEEQFDNLDLNSKYMEQAMDSSTAATMPTNQVDDLMGQIADEHGIDLESQLAEADPFKAKTLKNTAVEEDKEDNLEARLKKLQGI